MARYIVGEQATAQERDAAVDRLATKVIDQVSGQQTYYDIPVFHLVRPAYIDAFLWLDAGRWCAGPAADVAGADS